MVMGVEIMRIKNKEINMNWPLEQCFVGSVYRNKPIFCRFSVGRACISLSV